MPHCIVAALVATLVAAATIVAVAAIVATIEATVVVAAEVKAAAVEVLPLSSVGRGKTQLNLIRWQAQHTSGVNFHNGIIDQLLYISRCFLFHKSNLFMVKIMI